MKTRTEHKTNSRNTLVVKSPLTTGGRNKTKLNLTLRSLMRNNNAGTVTLDQMVKKTGVDRSEVTEFLQNVDGGTFIAGRRGHPSRFVFGEALEKWNHQEEIRREWRITNGRNPETGTLLQTNRRGPGRPPNTPKHFVSVTPNRSGMTLKVTVGEEEVSIPLKVELEKV